MSLGLSAEARSWNLARHVLSLSPWKFELEVLIAHDLITAPTPTHQELFRRASYEYEVLHRPWHRRIVNPNAESKNACRVSQRAFDQYDSEL